MATDKEVKKDYEGKLGVGTYIGKEIYQAVVGLGGVLGGSWAGLVAGARWFPHAMGLDEAKHTVKTMKTRHYGDAAKVKNYITASFLTKNQKTWETFHLHKVPGLKIVPSERGVYLSFAGMFLGSLISGLTLGYGHWKKEKQAQLQVDEITKDISDIEVFKKTDPELKKENTRLWAMLQEREQRGGKAPRDSWREQAHEPGSHERTV